MRIGLMRTAAAVLLAAGCADEDPSPESADVGTAATRLTDADFVLLMKQINNAEIGAAKLAHSKLASAGARAYAERMMADHAALNRAIARFRDDTVTRPPVMFATMKAVSSHDAAVLTNMPAGPAFDRAFLAMQATNHAEAIDSLRHWRQVVRDAAVRDAIDAAIPRVELHLSTARALLTRMGGTLAPGAVLPPPPDTSSLIDAPRDSTGYVVQPTRDTLPRPSPPDTATQ